MDKVAMVKKEIQLQNWSADRKGSAQAHIIIVCARSEKTCVSRYLYQLLRSRRIQKQSMRKSESYQEI